MNTFNLATFLSDSFKTVGVKFSDHSDSKVYTYKIPKSWTVEEGERIVVDSPYNGLVCVTVVRVDDEASYTTLLEDNSRIKWKWAVQQLDTTAYTARNEVEEQIVELYKTACAEKQRTAMKEEVLGSLSAEQAKVFEDLLKKI